MRSATRRVARVSASTPARMARLLIAAAAAAVAVLYPILAKGPSVPTAVLGVGLVAIPLLTLLAAHAYGTAADSRQILDHTLVRTNRLDRILDHSRQVAASLNFAAALEATAGLAADLVRCYAVRLWVADAETHQIKLAAARTITDRGPFQPTPEERTLEGEGVIEAARLGVSVTRTSPNLALVMVPLRFRTETVGVLAIELAAPLDAEDAALLEGFASQAATSIYAARATETAISERDEAEQLSLTDPLTGLNNRRSLDMDLGKEVARSRRHGRPLTVVMLDIDHFKKINDTHGHPRADQVLRDLAAVLRRHVRTEDEVYRFGGEEFAILFPDCAASFAGQLVERIRAAVEAEVPRPAPDAPPVTASFGAAVCPDESTDPAELVRLADRALYTAKEGGRNRVVVSATLRGGGNPAYAGDLQTIDGW